MLIEYISKPVTVLACEIKKEGKIKKEKEGVYVYTYKGRGAASTRLEFTTNAEQKVRIGDFIIKLADDCYLCPADVFKRKYGIKGMIIR